MDRQRFTHFESVMTVMNQAGIKPIVSGTFALEIITGYDLKATITPLIVPDALIEDSTTIDGLMQKAGLKRVDVPELAYMDDFVTLVFVQQTIIQALLGHPLPTQYSYKHLIPEYYVLNSFDLFNMFGALINEEARPFDLRKSDAQKLEFIQTLGYIIDRFPTRQMNETHPLKDVSFHLVTPADHADVGRVIREAFDEAAYSTLEEEKLVAKLRESAPFSERVIEIVAKAQGEIVGYGMISRVMWNGTPLVHKIGAIGPVVVLPEYRGRGLGWRLVESLEIVARYSQYGGLVALGWPGYWQHFGYVPAQDYGMDPAFNTEQDYFMAKEIIPGALLDAKGAVWYPKAWNFKQE
ncbi:MAG: N-acetyltransferase [Lactobacillaceae bacterium]|jgi:predicted N-acetyltransferase YhbS|nr:N-acetyltransferase [Lactobacillaceae bacterium]